MSERLVVAVRGVPDVLFVMAQPVYQLDDRGGQQLTVHAFTPDGLRSRTAQRRGGGDWQWLRRYDTGEQMPWGPLYSYEEETPEQRRAWHEREHGWKVIPHTVDADEDYARLP